MTKVVHDTDIGSGLEISGGKLNAATTMATDVEVADAIAAADVAEDAQLAAAIQASEALDATEEQKLLNNVRIQDGLYQNTVWELQGNKVKANTVAGTESRFLSISSLGSVISVEFHFPAAGSPIPSMQGAAPLVVDSNGFVDLPSWGVLWYKYAEAGQGWYWSIYSLSVTEPSSEYIRVLALNSYNATAQLSDGRVITQGLNYQDTNWVDISSSFVSGATNYGQGHQTLRVRRSGNRVYLEGLVSIAASYTGALFSLPAGFIPTLHHIFSGNIHDGTSRVDVSPTGVVSLTNHPSSHPWVSLAGINFGLD